MTGAAYIDHRNLDESDKLQITGDEYVPIQVNQKKKYFSDCVYLRYGKHPDRLLEIGFDSSSGDLRDLSLVLYNKIVEHAENPSFAEIEAYPIFVRDMGNQSEFVSDFNVSIKGHDLFLRFNDAVHTDCAIVVSRVHFLARQMCGKMLLTGVLIKALSNEQLAFVRRKIVKD